MGGVCSHLHEMNALKQKVIEKIGKCRRKEEKLCVTCL
jgi:hypothetical protein